eukprot:TRINITY_DN48066_c0_g1_i1.p2 TRINITY_DN48066_c0_g1~~TRINITY_DN48066_c0_g1_i1.p2  ORF type:complete len:229 (+),score=29.59 TRINITY_DN48066_c0_g1_i1:78-689(+)
MAMLVGVRLVGGGNYDDISPRGGLFGTREPSMPLAYFFITGIDGICSTHAAPIQSGEVSWQSTFNPIRLWDYAYDKLDVFVVDGKHWAPDLQQGAGNRNDNPPEQHLYGRVQVPLAQFKVGTEAKTVALLGKDGRPTTRTLTVEVTLDPSSPRRPSGPPCPVAAAQGPPVAVYPGAGNAPGGAGVAFPPGPPVPAVQCGDPCV